MKGTISGREERTLMKLIVDGASDRVVGCHMWVAGHAAMGTRDGGRPRAACDRPSPATPLPMRRGCRRAPLILTNRAAPIP
jgi:hypothetical protein